MEERAYLSIGEVLSLLKEEFPDVTISKIRFLESQGLLDPERTPSGYRKFYETDVERLRWILRQQREHFLPLKVIKGRLRGGDDAQRRRLDEAAPPGRRSRRTVRPTGRRPTGPAAARGGTAGLGDRVARACGRRSGGSGPADRPAARRTHAGALALAPALPSGPQVRTLPRCRRRRRA